MAGLQRDDSLAAPAGQAPVGEPKQPRPQQFVSADAAVAAFSGAPRVDPDRFREDLDDAMPGRLAVDAGP